MLRQHLLTQMSHLIFYVKNVGSTNFSNAFNRWIYHKSFMKKKALLVKIEGANKLRGGNRLKIVHKVEHGTEMTRTVPRLTSWTCYVNKANNLPFNIVLFCPNIKYNVSQRISFFSLSLLFLTFQFQDIKCWRTTYAPSLWPPVNI